MKKKTRITIGMVAAVGLAATATACGGGGGGGNSGAHNERKAQQQIENRLEINQPIPVNPYSQMRQNLIEIENAEANGVQSTTFFFNQGIKDPIMTCKSIGAPIPSTAQLSNPDKVERHGSQYDGGNVVIHQMEPNGVYTGDSTGTWSECLNAQGKPYPQYWEGFVSSAFGDATWDGHQIVVKDPSAVFSKHK